jgi:hypothetical protein
MKRCILPLEKADDPVPRSLGEAIGGSAAFPKFKDDRATSVWCGSSPDREKFDELRRRICATFTEL